MRRSMTLAEIDAAIERWQRRLFRAARAMEQLSKTRKRVALRRQADVAQALETSQPLPELPKVEVPEEPADDLSIPAQFVRQHNEADEKAKAEILAEIEAKKAIKAKASAAKSKAKAKGELRKMPLTGKAALAAINKAD